MMISQLQRKNNSTAWLLALFLLISGCLSFSATRYAEKASSKAKTELVISLRSNSKQAVSFLTLFSESSATDSRCSKVENVRIQNVLSKVKFDLLIQVRETFLPWLHLNKCISKTPEIDFAHLPG
jgi:hypothetical protein